MRCLKNASPHTLLFIQRMLLGITLWVLCSILFAYLSHTRLSSKRKTSLMGRELLEEPLDATTFLIQKLKRSKQTLDSITVVPSISEQEIIKILSQTSNLPMHYQYTKYYSDPKSFNKTKCSTPPSIYDLDFNNIYWQRLKIPTASFYLFNAYLDKREGVGKVPLVRIIGMIDKVSPPISYCKFWYSKKTSKNIEGSFVKAFYTYMWYDKWGNYKDGILQPFIISCPLIDTMSVPDSVSLVSEKCEKITNNMRIIHNEPKVREDFAVCVKGLDFLFEDLSVRLVEWIELLHIFGVKKIFIYELEVHPNMSKVLSYYVEKGLVELTPLTLPGKQPNLPGFRHLYLKSKLVNKRQNELIPYNDCLYKNLYSYKYIALMDTDEIIMPLKHKSWKSLMAEIMNSALKEKDYTRASYNFRNVYFLDDLQGDEVVHERSIPRYLHMLQHVYRSHNHTQPGSFVKCFHNVDRVVSLHNHFPMNCFGTCTTYAVNTSLAQLQHYRKDCVAPLKKSCEKFRSFTKRDTSIWRFKDELIRKTTDTLIHLNILKMPIRPQLLPHKQVKQYRQNKTDDYFMKMFAILSANHTSMKSTDNNKYTY